MKKILFSIAIFMLLGTSSISAMLLPQRTINLTINNLPQNAKVYALISPELLDYNIKDRIKDITNNNSSAHEGELEKLKEFESTKNYLEYVKFLSSEYAINNEYNNAFEIRNYYLDLVEASDILDYYEYNNTKYVEILMHFEENKSSIYMSDGLYDYDKLDTKFRIVTSDKEKIISLEAQKYDKIENANRALYEANVSTDYNSISDVSSINKTTPNSPNQNEVNNVVPKNNTIVKKSKTKLIPKAPDTASPASIVAIIMGLGLFTLVIYDVCKKYKLVPMLKAKLKK